MSDEVDHDKEILSCINGFNGNYDTFVSRVEALWKQKVDRTPILYSDLDNDPDRDPDRPHEPGQVLEVTNRENSIAMLIGETLSNHSELDLERSYDVVMDNPDVATKNDLLFLLETIGRPKRPRKSQSEKKSTRTNLKYFMLWNNYDLTTSNIVKLGKEDKQLILEWLGQLKPKTHLERSLKSQYDAAKEEAKKAATTEAECFKDIYNKVKKDVLKKR